MKENWKEDFFEQQINELNKRIDELEKENEYLRQKDKLNQETIRSVKQIEYEYYKGLDELKELKEKYRKIILDTRNIKRDYASKLNEAIKDIKKRK